MTILITGLVITICLAIRRHYDATRVQLQQIDRLFSAQPKLEAAAMPPPLDAAKPTAVFFVGKNRGVAMHKSSIHSMVIAEYSRCAKWVVATE